MLPPDPIELKVKEFLLKGEKTEAIKFFKEKAGVNFQEAKSFVENIEKDNAARPLHSNKIPNEVTVEQIEDKSINHNHQGLSNFIELNKDRLPKDKIYELNERIASLSNDRASRLKSMALKNPTTTLILSILLGQFGVDRFILKDYIFGAIKFLIFSSMAIMLRWTRDIGLDPLWDPVYSSGVQPPAIFVQIYEIGNHYNLGQLFLIGMAIFSVYDIATAMSRTKKFNYKIVIKELL
jgi:hypothetical protein